MVYGGYEGDEGEQDAALREFENAMEEYNGVALCLEEELAKNGIPFVTPLPSPL